MRVRGVEEGGGGGGGVRWEEDEMTLLEKHKSHH